MILKQLNLTWKCLINFNSCVPITTFRVHTILSQASVHGPGQYGIVNVTTLMLQYTKILCPTKYDK